MARRMNQKAGNNQCVMYCDDENKIPPVLVSVSVNIFAPPMQLMLSLVSNTIYLYVLVAFKIFATNFIFMEERISSAREEILGLDC